MSIFVYQAAELYRWVTGKDDFLLLDVRNATNNQLRGVLAGGASGLLPSYPGGVGSCGRAAHLGIRVHLPVCCARALQAEAGEGNAWSVLPMPAWGRPWISSIAVDSSIVVVLLSGRACLPALGTVRSPASMPLASAWWSAAM